ncbi:MAG: peptide chain release factor 1 [Spirochaetaceae bacterium]|nr:peptide chain release factor 1 [Spirochaetaceae bacterium]
MFDKIEELVAKYKEIEKKLSDPDIVKDQKKYKEIMQEHSYLHDVYETSEKYKNISVQIEGAKQIAQEEKDQQLKELAREEAKMLEEEQTKMLENLKQLLIPPDPLDLKNIIIEIRAGTGGDEAALFAANLYRMYSKYAETKKWKIEILSLNEIGLGGFKEIIFSVAGKNVYENLRYESGVHRVQRVPETESQGRIHTSAVTVAVLPEAEETDVEINPDDLKVDVYRSSGNGGQSVNTTDSAVRITHIPTGLVVTCQDEKSQLKNKAKALRVLRSRLYEIEEEKKQKERAEARKTQIGTGDRSERIRTYNFPQNRLTDHRVNLTLYKLEYIMEGDLTEVIEALKFSAKEKLLQKI